MRRTIHLLIVMACMTPLLSMACLPPPPAPPVVVRPPVPHPGARWIKGYYRWDRRLRKHVWVKGYWKHQAKKAAVKTHRRAVKAHRRRR